ncbi:flagellar basal body-associated FliL family protein [Sphingomonas sp. 1P06PA]|uniref:flagellar basal body-associated FliL family protein n=1 Tax=Sphingomonas sp. 1P06PA TaxID=554121 RepID=UPI0039A565CB
MSDDADKPVKKPGKFKKLLIPVIGAVVLLGGGVGAGLWASGSGMIGGSDGPSHAVDPNKPQLVPKGAEDPTAAEKDGKEEKAAEGEGGHGESAEGGDEAAAGHGRPTPGMAGGDRYEATYYPIEQNFTANLRDSDALVQVALGVSTFYDSRVIDNLKKHEMPVRSAILMTLGDEDPVAITTPEGKKALQKHLTQAVNEVLREKEGFGGIDDVYFTSFIVQ